MSGGWQTIESDAGVFTDLIEKLGVKGVQFEELLTLDADELAQLHPVYGVIFLFKYPTDQPYTGADKPLDGAFDYAAAENIFFAAQTIQNACGTQALLSVLLNKTEPEPESSAGGGGADDYVVDIGAQLRSFRDFTMFLPPDIRGEALSNSELIRDTHNSFARAMPFADELRRPADAEEEDAFHFVAYVPARGALYELDGLQPAPISHGACTPQEFPARVAEVLRRRVARYAASEIRFNLLAVVRDLRARARELGDAEALEREERKRAAWRFENALRRHNFLGFASEVLRGVIAGKLAEGGGEGGGGGGEAAYRRWIGDATAKFEKRVGEAQKRKAAGGGGGGGGGGDVEMGD